MAKVTIGKYTAIPDSLKGIMPHVPTEEMVRFHNWNLYNGDRFILKAPLYELRELVARWEKRGADRG